MTKFESITGGALAGALLVSATMAYARGEEEFSRRAGLKGTSVVPDQEGRKIEYLFSTPTTGRAPTTLLLKNGLGSPLESWDWISFLLKEEFNILRYHRRGYARTKSRLRPAQIVEQLVCEKAPDEEIVIVSHSLGSLVAANMLAESAELSRRVTAIMIIDGTDSDLLDDDRESPQRSGRFRQLAMQEALADVLGVNRWVPSKFERDVEYRPDVQKAFVITTTSVRTQIATIREYLHEPTCGQTHLAQLAISKHVVSASDNVEQQEKLAAKIGATFSQVPLSSHRSIIGKLQSAQIVAARIRETIGES